MSVTEIEIVPSRALQRYYPWVVIGIAFLTVGVAFGARNAFAVFLVAVIEEFRWSRGLASGALMLGSLLWTLSAPVIGVLLDRLGPRIVLPGGAILMASRLRRQRLREFDRRVLHRHGSFDGRRLCGAAHDLAGDVLIQLVHSQARHGDRRRRIGYRTGNSSGRSLDAVADHDLRLARRVFYSRRFVGARHRAVELFFSTPAARRDASQARLRRVGAREVRGARQSRERGRSESEGSAAQLGGFGRLHWACSPERFRCTWS